jgi:hypothetical protein
MGHLAQSLPDLHLAEAESEYLVFMNVFEAIPIGVFVASAVVGGRAADTWIPESDSFLRPVAVLLSALLCGFITVRLYFGFLNNRAKAHSAKEAERQKKSEE